MDSRPVLVDIGVNLTHRRFDTDRQAVLKRAAAAGVHWMVLTGADVAGSRAAVALASQYPNRLRATAGVHPHQAAHWQEDSACALRALAKQACVVAIGETGLDFNRDFSPHPAQERAFEQQLELAVELGLPVFLHQRDAHERFVALLRGYRDALPSAVVHCFTGGREELWAYLELDLHVGVTGWICDPRRGDALRDCVHEVPANRLMVETDAPYLTPKDLRPKPPHGRNEPAFLRHIVETVAELRGVSPETLAGETTATARAFFRLPD